MRHVRDYLPFIATENLMMEAVRRGGDRQEVHEIIRRASMAETEKMKQGEPWDLVAALAQEPAFGLTEDEIRALLIPEDYTGRAPQQARTMATRCRIWAVPAAEEAEINL